VHFSAKNRTESVYDKYEFLSILWCYIRKEPIMKHIELSKIHKRLISSLLFILEQKTEQIVHILTQTAENSSYIIEKDLTNEEVSDLLRTCSDLKKAINKTAVDVGIRKRRIYQRQYISTIQSHMWEHVSDAFHEKMTGYGEEVRLHAREVDPYIRQLFDLVGKLSV
jgi:hypothetical protein